MREHAVQVMPPAPKFRDLLGPSFILLGLGLGSGELILWPFLTSNYGMGIIWGAILGITLQFFMNMEIERYSLVRGESIFVGFARKFRFLPFWFILSTLAAWGWPGIVGASGKLFGEAVGFENTHFLSIALLLLIGLILTLGPILYQTVEKIAMTLIALGVPAIFILTVYIADKVHFASLLNGIVGIGDGYIFLPKDIPIASFLAAFAFAGAGGNLNLAQSFYVKEKGYGMGKFSGRITSILTGKVEDIKLEGARFEINKENILNFNKWWKLINLEHLIVFWAAGAVTICMLGLLAFVTAYGKTTPMAGIEFVIYEAVSIAAKTTPFVGTAFLIVGGFMLFNTQLTVFDATSRIMAENLLITQKDKWETRRLPVIYYTFLWIQIFFGIIVFLSNLREPLFLLTLSAVLNAAAMFVHIGLTLYLNMTSLETRVRPSLARILIMFFAFVFFGYFTARTIISVL